MRHTEKHMKTTVVACATLLALGLTAAPAAHASETACTPYQPQSCDTSVPVHDLADGIGVDREPFQFDLSHGVDVDSIEWSDGWRTWDGFFSNTAHYPTRDGATFTIPRVGEWEGKTVSATITVTDRNAGVIGTNPTNGSVSILTYTSADADRHGIDRPRDGERQGLGLRIHLSTDGETPEDGFQTISGFVDLDGDVVNHDPAAPGEGWEMIDGVDGVWTGSDAHLTRFGDNGWAGDTDENVNDSTDTAHARRHYLAFLAGRTFTVRYSAPQGGVNFISTFSPDATYNIRAWPLEYDLNNGDGRTPNDQ